MVFEVYQITGLNRNCINHKQFVSINGYDSELAEINCGVPQGFVLERLLFLLNTLMMSIKR